MTSPYPRFARSLALAAAFLPAAAGAQNQPTKPPSRDAGVIELADEPFRLDSIGLSMYLPAGARADSTSIGDRAGANQIGVNITPEDRVWEVRLLTPRTSNEKLTVHEATEDVLRQLLESASVNTESGRSETQATVLSREINLTINGNAAERFYVRLPGSGRASATIRGYTAFKVAQDRFCTFDLEVSEPLFEKAKRTYETMIGTVSFDNASALDTTRSAAVRTGIKVFETLSEPDFRAMVDRVPERWERLYRPAPAQGGDEKEIGYRRIQISAGQRGELDPTRDQATWATADRQEGYVVRIDSRLLLDGGVFDSRGVFFITPDRLIEGWNLQTARRDSGQTQTFEEIGVREGAIPTSPTGEAGSDLPRVELTVQTKGAGTGFKVYKPLIQGEGYITRVDSFLIPQILAHVGVETDYAFYVYDSQSTTVILRRDSLERGELPNTWKLTTRLRDSDKPQVSLYTQQGDLINTRLADGSIWEPVEIKRLHRLWTEKGLPVDSKIK